MKYGRVRTFTKAKNKNLNEIESDAQETSDQQNLDSICVHVHLRSLIKVFGSKDLHEIWDGDQEYI